MMIANPNTLVPLVFLKIPTLQLGFLPLLGPFTLRTEIFWAGENAVYSYAIL